MKEKDIYYSAIEANIANKNRIYRKAVNSRQRPGLKRGLAVAAACFVVMASVVACVLILIVEMVIYRAVSLKDLQEILVSTGVVSGALRVDF